jgi:hypothetical protein
MGARGEIFSTRATSGKRTYFFNVKENRHGDVFLNIVESKRSEESTDFERHSVLVFDEDLAGFMEGFTRALTFMKERKP